MNAFHRGKRIVLCPADKRLPAWESNVRRRTKEVCFDHPVSGDAWDISLTFFLKRPKTVKRRFPTTKPDLDKLVRGVLDPLSKVIYKDDSQVVSLSATRKYYVTDLEDECYDFITDEYGETPGVLIHLTVIPETGYNPV